MSAVFALAAAPAANAALLSYSFVGVAGTGSSLDLGAGPVDVSGMTFTAFGQTVNDIDLFNGGIAGDGVGAFAATTTYDFGAIGAFVTNAGADFYLQNCAGPVSVSCALLSTVNAGQGFRLDFAPAVAGDPDFGIAIGSQLNIGGQFITRTQTNSDGDSLTIASANARMISVNVTDAGVVPEPASLAIAGLGLALAGALARRRRAA